MVWPAIVKGHIELSGQTQTEGRGKKALGEELDKTNNHKSPSHLWILSLNGGGGCVKNCEVIKSMPIIEIKREVGNVCFVVRREEDSSVLYIKSQ